jgi:GR25 family glycosyltransferase involved in LPS biosynthesis
MKSFIIHLSKIESSLTTASNLKRQLEDFGMTAELFEGTYGTDAVTMMEGEGRLLHPVGIKGPIDTANEKINKMMTPGVKGCFYSHYRLWQKCVELNEPIIIWEDDIVLKRPFIEVNWNDVLVVALGHPTKSVRYLHFLESPDGEASAEAYFNSSMPGCCGYAIKPRAAKKLLKVYAKTFLPADNAINVHHVTIEIHNYIMGKALIKKDGKKSLTRTNFWNKEYE